MPDIAALVRARTGRASPVPGATLSLVLVATHNLMQGLKIGSLLEHYRQLRAERRLDVLCVQENRCVDGRSHTKAIADDLGGEYEELCDTERCGKGIVFNRNTLECKGHELFELPRLDRLAWLERRYIAGGQPDQRYVQIAQFEQADGEMLTVINFHLDTAGGNHHRRRQVEAIAGMVDAESRVVACGDTNAFGIRRRKHHELLSWMMEPLSSHGVSVAEGLGPTHYFGRQDEPVFTHRVMALLGKLGIDWPLRYDVVCTNAPVQDRGIRVTRESDHDLVWALLGSGD